MKKLLLGLLGVVAAGLGTSTVAAAGPYRAPIEVTVYNWTGFYIGGNVGFGRSNKSWDVFDTEAADYFAEGSHNATGVVVGGQIGYRWQAGSWVYGLEAQGNWAHLRGYNTSEDNFPQDNYSRIDSIGLFTGQIGYAWDATLFYVKGGAAVVNERFDVYDNTFVIPALLGETRSTRWGGTIGVGFEYGFTQNWTAGIEYDHVFLDTKNYDIQAVGGGILQTDRIRQDLDMVTLRLNYKFSR